MQWGRGIIEGGKLVEEYHEGGNSLADLIGKKEGSSGKKKLNNNNGERSKR